MRQQLPNQKSSLFLPRPTSLFSSPASSVPGRILHLSVRGAGLQAVENAELEMKMSQTSFPALLFRQITFAF